MIYTNVYQTTRFGTNLCYYKEAFCGIDAFLSSVKLLLVDVFFSINGH